MGMGFMRLGGDERDETAAAALLPAGTPRSDFCLSSPSPVRFSLPLSLSPPRQILIFDTKFVGLNNIRFANLSKYIIELRIISIHDIFTIFTLFTNFLILFNLAAHVK